MGWQHREGQTARRAEITLDPLLLGAFRIGITLVTAMAVDGPRTTAGTDRTKSFELIFAQLDRGASPNSSRAIKPHCVRLHDLTGSALLTPVVHPRSPRISQRYRMMTERGPVTPLHPDRKQVFVVTPEPGA